MYERRTGISFANKKCAVEMHKVYKLHVDLLVLHAIIYLLYAIFLKEVI